METQQITIETNEKKGIYVVLIILAISWGFMFVNLPFIRLVAWFSMGVTLFSLWRIIEGLFDRIEEEGGKYGK